MLNRILSQKGFTLFEILIGLIILAIGILAITGMQVISIKSISFSSNLSQASILAQERLEFLKSLDLNDSRLDTGDYPDDINKGILNGSYQAIRGPNFVKIIYNVKWVENGISHNVSFSTIKSR